MQTYLSRFILFYISMFLLNNLKIIKKIIISMLKPTSRTNFWQINPNSTVQSFVTLLSHLMADTLGVITCFLIEYFTPIRHDAMIAENPSSFTPLNVWLIKSIWSRPSACTSHFLHTLKTVVKRSQVSPTSLNNIISQRMCGPSTGSSLGWESCSLETCEKF